MGMDGLYRPSQALGFTDTLGHLNAAERAAETARQAHSVNQHRQIDPAGQDPDRENPRGRQQGSSGGSSLEAELKELFATQFNIQLEPETAYELAYNEQADRFELLEMLTGRVLLTLTPEAFLQVTEHMRRNAGVITDRSA